MLAEQQTMGLAAPCALYVDGAYVSSEALAEAREQGRELRGPAPASPDRGKVFTVEAFDVHVEERYAVCPASMRSSHCSRLVVQNTGKAVYRIEWNRALCGPCPKCSSASVRARAIAPSSSANCIACCKRGDGKCRPRHSSLSMHRRNGIEGTQS